MPNLVVYVPASVARALVMKGISEDIQRRACKEVLVGLADGELAAGAETVEGGQRTRPASRVTAPEAVAPAPSPKRCVRFQRHHVNHSGAPCPECGYPNEEGAVT